MIWLALLRRFWWAVPLLGLLGTIGVLHHERDSARAKVVALEDTLKAIQAAHTAAIKVATTEKENADAAYTSSSHAAALLGDSLSHRVRDYENRLRTRPVQDPGQPVATVGSVAAPEAARPDVEALLGDVVAACTRDATRLQNAVDWAATVAHDSAPVTRP